MFYFILRYIVRYRLKVVTENIARSFPEKSVRERALIVDGFYRHFVRQNFESLQFLFISSERIKRKFVFDNIELIEHFAAEHRNMTAVIGHYGHWDWMASED